MLQRLFYYFKIALIPSVLIEAASTWAMPDGSPVCVVGTYAPNPYAHRFPQGDLDGGYQITIGGTVLSRNEVLRVPSGVDLSFVISKTGSGAQFKGVLAIVNNPNIPLLNSLLPKSDDVKVQEECPPQGYSGFTHTYNFPKDSVEATLRLNTDVEAYLDVNVVVVNVAHQSIYFYSRYRIASFGIPSAPVPVPAPIPVPVPIPVLVPVSVPVPLPVPAPVPAPLAPVPVPAPVPVSSPFKAPEPVPITTPISRPASAPYPVPTPVLVPVPVPMPLRLPMTTSAPTNTPILAPSQCGFFGLSIFCFSGCGLFRRLLNMCD